MKLAELLNDDKAIITKVLGRGAFRKRLSEMGFVKGKEIVVVKNAPLKDPIEYRLMGYEVSLRRSEAEMIEVMTCNEARVLLNGAFTGTIDRKTLKTKAQERSKTIRIALVGNPNCGKTSLFNQATGAHEHVGNYSGVTVDAKLAKLTHKGYSFEITDLPGTYSISAYSPEERYVRDFILHKHPDLVVNVVDSSNLERNFFLTTQLIDMDIKLVVALNMYDELKKRGDRFDHDTLGNMLGAPMVPTIGRTGDGLEELFDRCIAVYEETDATLRHIHIHYGSELEETIRRLQTAIRAQDSVRLISSRYLTLSLLQGGDENEALLEGLPHKEDILAALALEQARLQALFDDDSEALVTEAKYGFIAGALKETFRESRSNRIEVSKRIDDFITDKVWGFPLFFFFMWLMFQATFSLGQYPMDWIDNLVGLISGVFSTYMPDGVLKDLIVDGIIGGVGGVIVFLPNILILFFFISLMEDTGYMARAAFIMDKLMHKIGLHGKSFIPLVMGFGCNVPAIMSTRTLENRNDRLLTMLINPFMSCSARLPVYVLIIAAVFPTHAGTVLFGIYATGIVLAALVALLFKKTLFRSKEAPFVMELPPYRIPTMRSIMRHMWHKAVQYLKKMGGVILIASILIWAMGYYPKQGKNWESFEQEKQRTEQHFTTLLSLKPEKQAEIAQQKAEALHHLELEQEADRQANSYIGRLGQFVSPVMQPLGFDWKMTVSVITGMAAKEIVVSTMGVLYQADTSADENSETLIHKIRQQRYTHGTRKGELVFTQGRALAFLVFILIYFPCVAVVAAVRKESGSWKWAVFMMSYTTGLAWLLAMLINQVSNLIA